MPKKSNFTETELHRSKTMFTRKNTLQILLLAVLVLTLSLSLTACQRASQQNSAGETSGVTIIFVVDPDPALVGQTQAVITLTDAGGQPITGASVAIKGDMSHAGMQPVLADAPEEAPGTYRTEFAWTMSGDWIVTVTATLSDGSTAEQQFDLSVTR